VIGAYAKNGKFEKAIEVFDSMKKDGIEPAVVTYNIMFDAYNKSGKVERAIEMFDSMKKDGIEPDVVTHTTMINAYAKSGFASMKDEVTFGALLDCFAKTGKHLR
jgi:pentatricopeptide repeat protein